MRDKRFGAYVRGGEVRAFHTHESTSSTGPAAVDLTPGRQARPRESARAGIDRARRALARCRTGKEAGVTVAALQSERVEETRDRAERGSVVRGSDQASVAAKGIPTD